MPIEVKEVRWFSTYHVHHRVADGSGRGASFLLGDAAHVHSPVGGQGMNTGIGDAVNLAWKLAGVLRGAAPAALLDSYEPERIAFARRLVATTDRAVPAGHARQRSGRRDPHALVPPVLRALVSQRRDPPLPVPHRLPDRDHLPARSALPRAGPARSTPAIGCRSCPRRRVPALLTTCSRCRRHGWHLQIHGQLPDALRSAAEAEAIPVRLHPWTRRPGRPGWRATPPIWSGPTPTSAGAIRTPRRRV